MEDIVEEYLYTVFRITYLKGDLYTRCISQKRPIYSLHISKGIYELVTSQKRHMYALQLSKETYKLVKYLKTDL